MTLLISTKQVQELLRSISKNNLLFVYIDYKNYTTHQFMIALSCVGDYLIKCEYTAGRIIDNAREVDSSYP